MHVDRVKFDLQGWTSDGGGYMSGTDRVRPPGSAVRRARLRSGGRCHVIERFSDGASRRVAGTGLRAGVQAPAAPVAWPQMAKRRVIPAR
ncbi:hypothetical protein GCM10023238_32860 [Streptomyces heliomycini]